MPDGEGRADAPVLVARQPIYDRSLEVTAYELLFRPLRGRLVPAAGTRATARVITDHLMELGVRALTGGPPAFLNFTRELIVGGYAQLLPVEDVVIEVLEDVAPDGEVLDALRSLRAGGRAIALDDVTSVARATAFRDVASIVKVDLPRVPAEALPALVADLRRALPRARLVAEKVETWDDYRRSRRLGFDEYQGYFLAKPVTVRHRAFTGFRPHYLQLLRATAGPDVDFDAVEQIVRGDIALTNKLLRRANSAAYLQMRHLGSVREAMVLLGADGVRRAAALFALAGLGQDRPAALTLESVLRARLCESIAAGCELRHSRLDLFVVGMFSLADAILGAPMHEVADELPVSEAVRAALVSREGLLGRVLAMVEAYERADRDAFVEQATLIGLDPEAVPALYREALAWAHDTFHEAAAA